MAALSSLWQAGLLGLLLAAMREVGGAAGLPLGPHVGKRVLQPQACVTVGMSLTLPELWFSRP